MKEDKFRCHPSIIAEKACGLITALFFIVISSLDDIEEMIIEGANSEFLLIILGTFILLVFVVVYNVFIWSKTFISIEENTIVIQRNTIKSKINRYSVKNISNINLEQNIFEQIMNTYKIKIDTDSLSTANTTDIEIVLFKTDAYEFKSKVLSIMNSENTKNNNMQNESCDSNINENKQHDYLEEQIDYDIVYSVNDVLRHCFYNFSLLKFLVGLGMLAFAIFVSSEMDSFKEVITIILVAVPSLIYILKAFVGDLFKYHNFSIKRLEDKLYISYGLLKKSKFTIPINRINSINIKQPILCRIFEKYQVDIDTIGVGDDESEGSQILLCSKKEDLLKHMKILIPELNISENLILERQAKKHYIIRIVDIFIGITFISLILFIGYKLDIGVPPILLLGIDLFMLLILFLIYYMSYITSGISLGEENLVVSYGVFSKKISIIKYKKVQYINVRQSPISAYLNLCSGEVYILASLGNDMRTIGYFDEKIFESLKYKILD